MVENRVFYLLLILCLYLGDTFSLNKYEQSFGLDEDAKLNFRELTSKYGYPTEEHTVTTEDGYILSIFRIPKGKDCKRHVYPRPLVLMHGLLDSSDTFVIPGTGIGLAYILSDACYDVWCPNHRGNKYSRKHETLDADIDKQYWNFTFDQHGMFDLRAIIDYVLEETVTDDLNFVGHSQGTTDFFVLASTFPEYNEKIHVAICLAPVAWLKHMVSPVLKALAQATRGIKIGLDLTGQTELFKRGRIMDKIMEYVCVILPDSMCGSFLFLLTGAITKNFEKKTLAKVFGHFPCSTSANNLVHWGQAAEADKFQRFDYGISENFEIYGSSDPPEYNVSEITAPVILITGNRDWLVSQQDVDTLASRLPNVVERYSMPLFTWSHIDFVWSKFIPEQLSPKLLEYLKNYGQTIENYLI